MGDIYQTKNYTAHGGTETIIGGSLRILSGASLIVDDGAVVSGIGDAGNSGSITHAATLIPNQVASKATTVTQLRDDFNALLTKLKSAGLMTADDEDESGVDSNSGN